MLHKIRPLGWPALRTVRTCDADGRERKGMIMWICTQISVYHFRARHASSAGQAACQAPQSARFFQSIFTIAGRVLRLKLKSLMRIDFTENLWKLRGLYSHPKETHFMNEKFCWWHLLVKVHPVRRSGPLNTWIHFIFQPLIYYVNLRCVMGLVLGLALWKRTNLKTGHAKYVAAERVVISAGPPRNARVDEVRVVEIHSSFQFYTWDWES